jgi:hypothetical protein
MEFVVVTEHESADSCQKGLKDMTILSIPEAFLVYTACKDAAEFAKGIVHMSFAFDYLPVLLQQKYCSVNGSIVFRHPVSLRTAVMFMTAEKILLDSGKMYCINKIHNIAWQDDDGVCEFLGILEAKLKLRIVKYAELTRNDIKYYAVATSDLSMRECVKNQLKFLRCEFGINVVYKEEDGTRTRRSTLFPMSLLNTDEILHGGLYSIITMKPYPTYVLASAAHKTVFGIDNGITEQRVNFEKFVPQYHTEPEMERIISECIPKMFAMEAGEVYAPRLEFKTPTGLRMYDVIIRNIGRSCMAVVFNESSDYTNT